MQIACHCFDNNAKQYTTRSYHTMHLNATSMFIIRRYVDSYVYKENWVCMCIAWAKNWFYLRTIHCNYPPWNLFRKPTEQFFFENLLMCIMYHANESALQSTTSRKRTKTNSNGNINMNKISSTKCCINRQRTKWQLFFLKIFESAIEYAYHL